MIKVSVKSTIPNIFWTKLWQIGIKSKYICIADLATGQSTWDLNTNLGAKGTSIRAIKCIYRAYFKVELTASGSLCCSRKAENSTSRSFVVPIDRPCQAGTEGAGADVGSNPEVQTVVLIFIAYISALPFSSKKLRMAPSKKPETAYLFQIFNALNYYSVLSRKTWYLLPIPQHLQIQPLKSVLKA